MNGLVTKCAAIIPVMLCLPGLAAAEFKCKTEYLRGQYVFTATGFTRAPNSVPGTPWVPKAIVEVLEFNGDGTLTTPVLTFANPFGDLGGVFQVPGGGAPGTYSVNEDCTGTVQFLDANSVTFKIQVDLLGGMLWMIQTNPANNVIQGSAKRVR